MLRFSTKADTLRLLATVMRTANVLPQVSFYVREYVKNTCDVISLLENASLLSMPLIVRSSAQNEDTENSSNAGCFLSLANVRGKSEIMDAVSRVVASMGDDEENQVFIQPYLEKVSMCGVAFTIDPNTGGNYYIINYDDTTGQTSSVTGGFGEALKTYCQFKGTQITGTALEPVITACMELEDLFANNALDIEFAVSNGILYILQVRPLVLKTKSADLLEQINAIAKIQTKLHHAMRKQPNIFGDRTIFGIMPDWNPAEMIGIRPRPLALSLYKEIITDGVWAYQRNNYGYKNLRSFPLMFDFCGLPYIDTRVSFNSFLPKDLSNDLSQKLINYDLDQLQKEPSKHDKIEFEIAFTCYTFDLRERLQKLKDSGFSDMEIEELAAALLRLTNRVIDSEHGLCKIDRSKIDILCEQHILIMDSNMDKLSKVYWLLENCKRYGTLPFAGLARAGFIAAEFLKSLVRIGILTEREKALYMNSISTIGKEISEDFKILTKSAFLKKYGHLRPGTYDIRSPRYDQSGDNYFNFEMQNIDSSIESDEFRLSLIQYADIQKHLNQNGMTVSVLELFDFIKVATEGREYSKYIFTKTLSDVLELLAQLGESYNLSRDDMSFVNIKELMDSYTSCCDIKELLTDSISKGRMNYHVAESLLLPPLLIEEQNAIAFFMPDGEPNYITQNSCEAPCVLLTDAKTDITGKIVLIRSADPGYDWIFSRGIAGFITAYGGANSHMAIRAAEFGTPAIIGTGEKLFTQYSTAKKLRFDCANRKVFILS